MIKYDVLIIGGGVSGTALAYTLSNFTNIGTIALLEKYSKPGLVNSKLTNNSQTLHSGDIETNYNYEKAKKVKRKADMLKYFLEEYKVDHPEAKLFARYNKMILAVGNKEVSDLEKRWNEFQHLFPSLRRIERDEIAKLEPEVMKNRDPKEPVLALSSDEGYTIDYGAVSEVFLQESGSNVDSYFNTQVVSITKTESDYHIITNTGKEFRARVVAVCAGGHTPLIAQSLGYAKNFSILSVAGSFFKSTRKILNGKVYTMQIEKLPFAAVHGDPDVYNANETRFGPTAKGIFMLERYNYKSVREYFKVFGFRWKAFKIIANLTFDRIIGPYLFRNFRYDIPWIGKRLFVKELKKIVPSLKASDIEHGDKLGGTRPQILNLDTMQLEMGEAKISGDHILFNITPSPGATTCLANAYEETQQIMEFFAGEFKFDKTRFESRFVK